MRRRVLLVARNESCCLPRITRTPPIVRGASGVDAAGAKRDNERTRVYALTMTPIPSDPLKRPPAELTLGDGRKVKLNIPRLDPAAQPSETVERGAVESARYDPRPPIDPNAAAGG